MRKLDGIVAKGVWLYILVMGIFHMYTAAFGAFEAYLQRGIHLAMVLPLVFVLYPVSAKLKGEKKVPIYDWIFAILSALPGIYIVLNYNDIVARMVQVDEVTTAQLVLGTIVLLTLLETTRRTVGLPIIVVALAFMGYCTYYCMGDYAAQIGATGINSSNFVDCFKYAYNLLVEEMYLTDEGIYSSSLGVSATLVIMFLIFGGFLETSGVGEYFMEFSQAFTGTQVGGPAKIAIVSCCLFGSISGSAVANVYGTGTFTYPLMKKSGYTTDFAAAILAVASTGGQIMPPVMGAGAFVMASFLNLKFQYIIIAAILPALLYYGSILFIVHLNAKRDNLQGLSADELPAFKKTLMRIYMASPIILLFYMLFVGYSAMYSALAGIVLAWAVSLPNPKHRMGPKGILKAIHDGTKGIPVVCTACASSGLVLGSVSLSGIGPKIIRLVLSISGGNTLITLLLVAIVCLILGMGLPTTSAYILASSLCAPALAQLGFPVIAAHMFVFYYAIISCITPPVALAAYAAASLCSTNPNKTGWQACRLGFIAFVVPFAFCYDTGLLLQLDWLHNVISILSGVALVTAVAFSFSGYVSARIPMWLRVVFLAVGLSCIWSNMMVSLAGTAAVIALTIFARVTFKDKTKLA